MMKWRVEQKSYPNRKKGGTKITKKYYLIIGRERIKTGKETKEEAEQWARKYIRESKSGKQNMTETNRLRKKSLGDLVKHWAQLLPDSEWSEILVARIGKLNGWCGFTTTRNLDAHQVDQVLQTKVAKGEISVRTRSHYIQAARQFGDFLIGNNIVEINPFKAINGDGKPILKIRKPKMSEKTRCRRYLLPDELKKLVTAAETGPTLQRISGIDRAMFYRMAAGTGLRKSELSTVSNMTALH